MGNKYGYLPIPKDLYFNVLQLEVNPTERRILQYIIGKLYEWPETRKGNTIELSCRYIDKAIGISYGQVARALKNLEIKGFIARKISHFKNTGSLISLKLSNLNVCESFIEQKLYNLLNRSFEDNNLNKRFTITPQYPVPKTPYRVDLFIRDDKTRKPVCIIECDGHEFHEKTKEQVQEDKKRDRILAKKGYIVLRFTGSEIINDVNNCVSEIVNFVKGDIL